MFVPFKGRPSCLSEAPWPYISVLPVYLVLLVLLKVVSLRGTTIISFESSSDSTILAIQSQGLTLPTTIILRSRISPPQSGTNATFDNNGPVLTVFDIPALSFAAFLTNGLTLLGLLELKYPLLILDGCLNWRYSYHIL